MSLRPALAAFALLALALGPSQALGYVGSREVIAPDGWDDPFTGGAHLGFCERWSDDLSEEEVSPVYCEGFGFAAQFADIGCSADFDPPGPVFFGNGVADNDATAGNGNTLTGAPGTACLDDIDGVGAPGTGDGNDATIDDFAGGSITISYASGTGGEVSALVANDRDDDDQLEESDEDGSSDQTDETTTVGADNDCDENDDSVDDPLSNGCFDDELADGTGIVDDTPTNLSIGFCFSRDRAHAGGDFDDFTVFLSTNVPGALSPYAGSVSVVLTASSGTNAGACGGANRSGHNDNAYYGGGNPFLPADDDLPDVGLPAGVVVIADVNGAVSVQVDVTDVDCQIDTDLTAGGNEIPLVALSPIDVDEGYDVSVTCQTGGACSQVAIIAASTTPYSAKSECDAATLSASTTTVPVGTGGDNAGTAGPIWVCAYAGVGTPRVAVVVCIYVK